MQHNMQHTTADATQHAAYNGGCNATCSIQRRMQQVIEYRKLETHEILCAEGDLPDYYYVIVSGR